MTVFKTMLAIILCIVGVLFVVFEIGMLVSEPHLFWTDGWVPFSVFVVLGVIIFVGGIVILLGTFWKR